MNTSLVALETFVTAVRAGSFAAAARQIGVSPALVGRRIEALERDFGSRLIERSTRSQRLTEAGEAFLARAEAVLEAAQDLEELAGGEPGHLSGRIRVTAPVMLGITTLSAATAAFCAAHPRVTVELVLDDRRADLIADGFDLAIRIGDLPASSLVGRRIGTYRLRASAAPAYLAAAGVPRDPADLAAHRCLINLKITPRNRWPFHGPDGKAVVAEVEGNLQVDNDEALRAAALAGAGIVYLPEGVVAADLKAGRLVEVLPGWQPLAMPIHLVHPGRRLVPRRLRAYMDAIAAAVRD